MSGEGLTSSNKDKSINFSGEKKKYNEAFRGVCFLIIHGKTNKSNLVLLLLVLHPIISLNFPQNNLNHETTH